MARRNDVATAYYSCNFQRVQQCNNRAQPQRQLKQQPLPQPPHYRPCLLTVRESTFGAPLYTSMFAAYDTLTGIQVNYQAVGSGAGITAITNGTVDFGASDAIMTSAQDAAAQAASGPILAIPTTMGAVAISYNIPGWAITSSNSRDMYWQTFI